MKCWWIACCLALFVATLAGAQENEREVTGQGSATAEHGDRRRAIALTAALQDAVRQAGTDLLSVSKVRDFTLEYDRVFAQAFGHVRSYTVLRQWEETDGSYHVQVRARVKPGAPALRDAMALRMVVNLKDKPRIGMLVNEQITGLDRTTDFARSWIEQAAQEMNLRVVDMKQTQWNNQLEAAKDEFHGDDYKAALRRLNVARDYDYLITADLIGQVHGLDPQMRAKGLTAQLVSVGGDLRVIRADTGETLVTVPLSGAVQNSLVPDPGLAARDVIHRELNMERSSGKANGYTLFTRLFTTWVTELDLGHILQLEFEQLQDRERGELVNSLRKTEKIMQVWPREFDARGLSRLEIETMLDADALRRLILDTTRGAFALQEMTASYLQFIPSANRAPAGRVRPAPPSEHTPAAPPAPAPITNTAENSISTEGGPSVTVVNQTVDPTPAPTPAPAPTPVPPWIWIAAGLGLVALLTGAFLLGRKS